MSRLYIMKKINEEKRDRFHIDFGPKSLFENTKYKMKNVRVDIYGEHFIQRLEERHIPDNILDKLIFFNQKDWRLKEVETLKSNGSIINSTWEIKDKTTTYWVTIDTTGYAMTIFEQNNSGIEKCIQGGITYNFVDQVHKTEIENRKHKDEFYDFTHCKVKVDVPESIKENHIEIYNRIKLLIEKRIERINKNIERIKICLSDLNKNGKKKKKENLI